MRRLWVDMKSLLGNLRLYGGTAVALYLGHRASTDFDFVTPCADLGYDPRPDVTHWRGTPIPPVDNPVAITPDRATVARRVWWNGDPWTILRNGPRFVQCIMDNGSDEHIRFSRTDLPESLWLLALDRARPGVVSFGAYALWSILLKGGLPPDHAEWPRDAHRKDIPMMRGCSRESMYERQRLHRERTQRHRTKELKL